MVSASTRRCLGAGCRSMAGGGFTGLYWSAAYGPNAAPGSMDRLSGGVLRSGQHSLFMSAVNQCLRD